MNMMWTRCFGTKSLASSAAAAAAMMVTLPLGATALLGAGGPPLGTTTTQVEEAGIVYATPIATSSSSSNNSSNQDESTSTDDWMMDVDTLRVRTRKTPPDLYYKTHQELPPPQIMHAVLPLGDRNRRVLQQGDEGDSDASQQRKGILVMGDVHGCFDEMLQLHEKAIQENGATPFEFVIMVGDLCNKGPFSAKVIRWVRTQENWLSVRGNHDDGALAAALGDIKKRKKKKYQWVLEGEAEEIMAGNGDIKKSRKSSKKGGEKRTLTTTTEVPDQKPVTLNDDDVKWMAELPYSITIPGSYLGQDEDTLVIHAGLIPQHELEAQAIETMTTMREVLPVCDVSGQVTDLVFHEREDGNEAQVSDNNQMQCEVPLPWASIWKGPQRIIFGHDARRGLQQYDGDWALGLDTGAVYGRQMTAVILPERKLVSIDTTEYCATGK